uniref:Cytochrome c biogenesis protein CcsA n=1 Tax=Neocystis brevis TaxID=1065496 RepID=A0A097KMG9_9CHLO|nr:heme attachment to plastid cytochrome c [Neocystis brevis]AIT94386.1 heme attachment to plastid cytochrome c [Neocystis brevis]
MLSTQIETFLGNSCFTALFMLMLLYWVQASFHFITNFSKFGLLSTIFVNFLLLSLLVVRWFHYGHFPLSNLYESLVFLSWSLTLLQLILEKISKNIFLGAVISPMALFTNSFATFSLPKEMQKASVLVPALQSNWLMMHVTIMMLSYAALICGSLLAITFLLITHGNNLKLENTPKTLSLVEPRSFDQPELSKIAQTNRFENNHDEPIFSSDDSNKLVPLYKPLFRNQQNFPLGNLDSNRILTHEEKVTHKGRELCSSQTLNLEERSFNENKLAETLDNLSYRTLGIGFPLLTIGILSGSVWANEAWGSYWSWDPKETWAFITWLVFAIYLHTRITKGWQGKKPAIIASVGFLIVWVCYLGVNLLGKGLHSYGWIH